MGQYFSSISNHENNQYYLPEDGSSVMDIRVNTNVKLSVQAADLEESLGQAGQEEAVSPLSFLADKQAEISEALAASFDAKLEEVSNTDFRSTAWCNTPPEPEQDGEEWKIEIALRAHLQGSPIKESLVGRLGGKLSDEIAEKSKAQQEAEVQEKASEVKAALDATISENQDVFSPLIITGVSDESQIEYTAEMRYDQGYDAFLGSETRKLPAS